MDFRRLISFLVSGIAIPERVSSTGMPKNKVRVKTIQPIEQQQVGGKIKGYV
jgi:hypothetical protein